MLKEAGVGTPKDVVRAYPASISGRRSASTSPRMFRVCGNGVTALTGVIDWLDQTLLLNPDV